MELYPDEKIDISFIFTENDFVVDYYEAETSEQNNHYRDLFKSDPMSALYHLAFIENTDDFSPSMRFMLSVSKCFLNNLLQSPGIEQLRETIIPKYEQADIDELIENVPFVIGAENVTANWINQVFTKLCYQYHKELSCYSGSVDMYFYQKSHKYLVPSRIYFQLVENTNGITPFAFLATYSSADKTGKICHYPLRYALSEYGNDQTKLHQLVSSIYKVSHNSAFIDALVKSGEIFSPLNFSVDEAFTFLQECVIYEDAGIICRIPNWWRKRKASASIMLTLSEKMADGKGYLSKDAICAILPQMVYEGIAITESEALDLLSKTDGLFNLKGKWVEIDHKKLNELLEQYRVLRNEGATFYEVLHLIAGISKTKDTINIEFEHKDWLNKFLNASIEKNTRLGDVPDTFCGTLRRYQIEAYQWLYGMWKIGLGVCLADDMGLGKTIEILAFLEQLRKENVKHVLLVVPASLIANWKREISKFTPQLEYQVVHGSADSAGFNNKFLTITTYQTAVKTKQLREIDWDIIILDEAQAIKNYYTQQTMTIKAFHRRIGITMTGTPIENTLWNLWSIFDFINPGLLGNQAQFSPYRNLCDSDAKYRESLKNTISPFILRRLKTDKRIISDLPDKNEVDVIISLVREQIVLYREIVSSLNEKLKSFRTERRSKFEEKALVLQAIVKLKQVCNHPDQYLGNVDYDPSQSGKFLALHEICSTICENREKVLIFSQFKEIIPYLDNYLANIFRCRGFSISGDTPLNKRNEYVDRFQNDHYPYMILSLKTGGVGLNLTAATNVVHFDRWWNPAVENQATDRVFRIGQTKKVSVFKFICADTIEEKIDFMLKDKYELSESIVGDISTSIVSKLSVEELTKTMQFFGEA